MSTFFDHETIVAMKGHPATGTFLNYPLFRRSK